MADKKDEVTLASVFKDLASSLNDAINDADSDEEENEDSEQEDKGSDGEEKADKKDESKDDGNDAENKDESDDDGDGDGDEAGVADLKTELKAVTDEVASIKQLLTAEDGDFRKALTEMVSTLQTHGDVLEKALERIENLEEGTAVSKSIDGDDSGDENESKTPEEKATAGLHKAVVGLAKNPGGSPR